MPLTAGLIIGGSSLASGVIGNMAASADRDAANQARQQALQQWLAVNVPDPQEQMIQLEHFKQTGQLTPELEKTFQQQKSELSNINVDPTSRQAELSALTKLQDISNNNGLDAQSKAQYQALQDKLNANEAGQRGAIVQNFAQRGMGGSGAELQAQLLASQQEANRASQQGMDIAAQSEQRALQALMNSNNVASNMYGQDYQRQLDEAKAQDAINQFNTRSAQSVAGANVDRANNAQKYNLDLQQRIADQNVGINNQQEIHNKDLYQQQFQNEAQKAAGASGQYGNVANQYSGNADRTANKWAGIGQAIGQGAGAYGQYANSKAQTDAYNRRTDKMYGEEE